MAEKESQTEELSKKIPTDSSSAPEEVNIPGKSSWPEVVGLTGEEAKMKIEAETGDSYRIHVVPSGSAVTMDYRTDRIRIYVDESGKVTHPPTTG